MKNIRVSVVIPLYNERDSIPELLAGIRKALTGKYVFEILCIDDGSTDGSFDVLRQEKKKSKEAIMTLVRFRKNSGKSAALAEGFARASGDIVVTLDADLQDDAAEIPNLIRVLDGGYDLVVGWRKKRQDSRGKLTVSHVFNRSVSIFSGIHLHDMNSGLKAMKREVSSGIQLYGELHRYIPVLAHALGFRITEVPVSHHPRKYGNSKFGFERILASFDLVSVLFLQGYGTRPFVIFGPPGMVLIFIGFIVLMYLSVLHFLGEPIGTRPILLFGVLAVIFGLQLISIGLLSELVTKSGIRNEKRPVAQVIT